MMKMLKPLSGVLLAMSAITGANATTSEDLQLLREFTVDYANDVTFKKAATFGIKIADDFYTVKAVPASETVPSAVDVEPGEPAEPTFYYTLDDSAHLKKLASGEFNALTLMAKAFSTDVTPMDIEMQDGFQPPEDFMGTLLPLTFHFWTKGQPAIIPYGPDNTRKTHGTNAGIFYYQPGFRSGWFNIEPGDHVNEDKNSRSNPFPSMFILIKGEVTTRIDGKDSQFTEGNAMVIPAGVTHEFFNRGTKPAFGFLFMIGEGA